IPAEDTHLKYAARLALRNSLQKVEDWAKGGIPANDPVVADAALGIPTEKSAKYLAEAYKEKAIPRNRELDVAEFIGRRGTNQEWPVVFRTNLTSRLETVRAAEALIRGVQAAGPEHLSLVIREGLSGLIIVDS